MGPVAPPPRPATATSLAMRLPSVARRSNAAANLHRCAVYVPQPMLPRLDKIAGDAGRLLGVGVEVSRAALVRAALGPWIDKIELLSVMGVVEEVRRAEAAIGTRRHRTKLGWPKDMLRRLDKLREQVGGELLFHAAKGRSALVLAALTPWLDDAERELSAVLEAIRGAVVKRGRKPTRAPPTAASRPVDVARQRPGSSPEAEPP